jgi:hypothetical protein
MSNGHGPHEPYNGKGNYGESAFKLMELNDDFFQNLEEDGEFLNLADAS